MAKIWNKTTHTPATTGRGKKTSQGRRNIGTATMNKNKKANLKKFRSEMQKRSKRKHYRKIRGFR